jgi:hypothetical protein
LSLKSLVTTLTLTQILSLSLTLTLTLLGCERLRINNKSKDVLSDLAVAFFESEEAAFSALMSLKTTTIDGEKISASYRFTLFFLSLSLSLSLFLSLSLSLSLSSSLSLTLSTLSLSLSLSHTNTHTHTHTFSLREVAEPAVVISNLPSNCKEEDVLELFSLYAPDRVEITKVRVKVNVMVRVRFKIRVKIRVRVRYT